MTARRLPLLLIAMTAASAAFGQVIITSTSPLPQGFSTIPYTYTFTAVENTTDFIIAWSLPAGQTANLPTGFSLSANGTFSGTTNQFGTFTFQATATAGPFSATQTFSVTLLNPFITINSPPILTNGFVNQPYSLPLLASSNPSGLIWSLAGGTQLPPGLSLSTSGLLSGVPSATGTFMFAVNVQIAGTSIVTNQPFTLNVYAGQVAIQTKALPLAVRMLAYAATLAVNPPAATWVLTGTLPPGITFNQNTGALAGTTGSVGVYPLTFQANYLNYISATENVNLYVTTGPLAMQPNLPPAVQGSPYQTTLTGSGGLPPYSWSLGAGTPAGLSVVSTSGAITGTPQTAGNYNVPVTLTDATGQSITNFLPMSVATPLTVATTTLPNGSVGVPYSQILLAGGSQATFTWTLTGGSLPPGLMLSTSGVVSGTPTASGTYPFTVNVADNGGRSATGTVTVSIGVTPVSITTSSLPNGQLTVLYSQALAATGGIAPYTWSKVSGTLPAGLALNANGTITGTPAGPLGISTFAVQATDSSTGTPLTAQKAFTINIALTLTITTELLPGGTVGVPYSQTLAGSGGTAPYIWSITTGTLPPGLQLNASTGVIAGTPTSTGPNLFTVTLADSAGLTTQQPLSILVSALTVTSSTSFSATVGTAFSQTLTAVNGTSPYAWSIVSGSASLPVGLQLSSNGVISGTPTTAGTSNVTVRVTDSQQATGTAAIVITVNAAATPLPTVSIGTIPGTPATQPSVSVTLASAYSSNITGTISVSFQSTAGGNPTEVQFFTNAGAFTNLAFNIPAGSTTAAFPNAPVLATGTVAGTITLTANISAGGQTGSGTEAIVIPAAAPVIQSVAFTNSGGSLSVTVTGYSTTREMVSGQFTFAPATGSSLSQSVITVQLASAFATWYQSSASNPWGGQFQLTVPFGVGGNSADVVGVSVILTNTKGASASASPH